MGGVAQEGFVFRGPVPTFGTTPRAEAGRGGVGTRPPDCGLAGSVARSAVSGTGLDLPRRTDQRGPSSTPPSVFARAGSPGTRSGLDGGPTRPHSLGSFVGYFRDKAPVPPYGAHSTKRHALVSSRPSIRGRCLLGGAVPFGYRRIPSGPAIGRPVPRYAGAALP